LSELLLTLGDVTAAVASGEQAVNYADRSSDEFRRLLNRTTHANALHQAGHRNEAAERLREAEEIQALTDPEHPLLYSVQGFRYCDLLLADVERSVPLRPVSGSGGRASVLEELSDVVSRASQSLDLVSQGGDLLSIALDHLTLGRAALHKAIVEPRDLHTEDASGELDEAVAGLRRAGMFDYLPRGLLARAWLRSLTRAQTGPESAQSDLDEAWDVAERGPMPLFLADIHLHRARLLHDVTPYPWAIDGDGNPRGPRDDLADARRLIEQHGYWRRKEELENTEAAAANWPLAGA
jgi:hypothetical protein